jgi:hypothetical protein
MRIASSQTVFLFCVLFLQTADARARPSGVGDNDHNNNLVGSTAVGPPLI